MKRLRIMMAGGVIAGLLDIIFAFVFYGVRNHVPPIRIGQGIASYVMGNMAFEGGWGSSIVGLGLHFAIAIVMALIFYAVCRKLPVVARHALVFSPVYGVALYLGMTYFVLPLTSREAYPAFPPAMTIALAGALFAHVVLVALPIAVYAKRALKSA